MKDFIHCIGMDFGWNGTYVNYAIYVGEIQKNL